MFLLCSEEKPHPWRSKRSQRKAHLQISLGKIVTEKNLLNNHPKVGGSSLNDAKNLKNSLQESKNRQMFDIKPVNTNLGMRGTGSFFLSLANVCCGTFTSRPPLPFFVCDFSGWY